MSTTHQEDNAQTYSMAKPEINASSVLAQNSCYDHTVSLARALQQELHGAIQEEKNHSQYYCSVYTFALPLSLP